jgi:transposase
VTKPYSVAFKQKMVQRLIGKDSISAMELERETGVRQQNLSRWLLEARSLPKVARDQKKPRWTVEQKAQLVTATANLTGEKLKSFLEREGVKLAELEEWRLALDGRETASMSMTRRIRNLERELARKEKALAEAAALLILKKKVDALFLDGEDADSDDESER